MQEITLKRFVTLSTDLKEDEYKEGLSKYSKDDFIEYFLEMQKEDMKELENENESSYDDADIDNFNDSENEDDF